MSVRLLQLLMAGLTLTVLWGVFSRYVIGEQSSWTEELARCLLIWVSFVGAGVAFEQKAHLGVDALERWLDFPSAKLARIISSFAVLAFCVILISGGYKAALKSFSMDQILIAMGISKGYVYIAIFYLGIQGSLLSMQHLFEGLSVVKEPDHGD